MSTIPEYWSKCKLFVGIDLNELEDLYSSFEQVTFGGNDYIIREGDLGEDFYIIKNGTVDIFKNNILIAQKHTGDYFGIMSLLDKSTRSADVVSKGNVDLVKTSYVGLKTKTADFITEKILANHFLQLQNTIRDMNDAAVNQLKLTVDNAKQIDELRTKISSDLHDEVGSILAGIAMQSELMSINMKDGVAQEISKKSREAMQNMRDIVWSIDNRKNKYANLIDRMRYFTENNLDQTKFKFNLSLLNINETQKLSRLIRKNIFLIFKEAITNISKYSNGNLVNATLEIKDNAHLNFVIEDNGNLVVQNLSDGMGLQNMGLRAKNMKATIMIEKSNGFKIKISAPLT